MGDTDVLFAGIIPMNNYMNDIYNYKARKQFTTCWGYDHEKL